MIRVSKPEQKRCASRGLHDSGAKKGTMVKGLRFQAAVRAKLEHMQSECSQLLAPKSRRIFRYKQFTIGAMRENRGPREEITELAPVLAPKASLMS